VSTAIESVAAAFTVEALGSRVCTYWQSLYRNAIRMGKPPENAEVLVQGELAHSQLSSRESASEKKPQIMSDCAELWTLLLNAYARRIR